MEGERKVRPDRRAQPSYHGVSFAEAAGPAAFATYVRAILLRDEGACISPFNAWVLLQGTETCRCALTVMLRTPRRSLSSWLVTATSPR
ncbi:MAG: hypothetical protein ACLU37_05150 [Collinsella sp.]